MLKEISELLPAVNYAAFQVPSMEEAIDKQSVASAMRYGAFSSEELSWVYESLSDTNGNTVEGAAALNASSNGGPGYGAPADPALKQAFSMRGSNISDLVDIFLADLDANDRRALGVTDGAASIACSTPGLIVQAIAGAALLITGPGGIAAKGASLAQSMAVQTLLASLLGDLVQDRTQSLAREVCGINEEGRTVDAHKFGNCMAYGARGAHNLSALSAGGVDLSESQERTLAMRLDVQERSEFMQRSFFARIFDTAEPRSLAVSILGRMSRLDSVQGAAGLLSKITSIPTGLFSGAAAQLTPKALAQTDSYKWEFPLVSIPVEIFEDPKYEDPFENQKIVADILKDSSIRERAKTCWGVNITQGANGWQATAVEEVVQAENAYVDAKCSDFRYGESDEDEPWIRTSLFVFDDNIALTADCLDPEGDESSCTELGFSAQPHTTQPSSLNVPGLNGYVVPCTGQPTQIVRRNQGTNGPSAIWTNIQDSGTIGTNSAGEPIKVYIREACSAVNTKTIVIVSSIHGTENGGQFVAHDLLFNAQLPPNVRIVAIPELLPESSIAARNRRNANGVDLNRNFDYRWTQSSDSDETTPGARSYRGTAPASEPETAAIISFLQALGDVSLLLTYHDNLNYVAPVGLTPFPIANTYASATGMHGQCDQNPSDDNCAMKTVNQSGSLDGWYHHTTGHPTLLIELSSDESQAVISRHVEAVKAVVEGGHL